MADVTEMRASFAKSRSPSPDERSDIRGPHARVLSRLIGPASSCADGGRLFGQSRDFVMDNRSVFSTYRHRDGCPGYRRAHPGYACSSELPHSSTKLSRRVVADCADQPVVSDPVSDGTCSEVFLIRPTRREILARVTGGPF
jgi:hypothetical protein